jgi:hypothetical protein
MSKGLILAICAVISMTFLFTSPAALAIEPFPSVVIFSDAQFPAADSAAPSAEQLAKMLPGAHLARADELGALLNTASARVLVLPYGSSFPEAAWTDIYQFLHHGGNLLVLGGRPFTRSAYRDSSGWKLRDYSVRFTRALMIDQYLATPGSDGIDFQANPDAIPQLPHFGWKRAFSPVIRLSMTDLYKRDGSAGSIDARLQSLAWGVKDHRKVSAPVLQIDHLRNGFDGGRWVFLSAELGPDFYHSQHATEIVRALAEAAMHGSQEFSVRPALPLYLPGEPVELNLVWHAKQDAADQPGKPLTVRITSFPEQAPSNRSVITIPLPSSQPSTLPAPSGKGLWIIESELLEGDKIRAIDHSGFWIRDDEFLRSGPRLTVNRDFFELDGHPLAVVGTTYMSSEVQRLYFEQPNVYVWDRDLAQIHDAGLNMIRTGWWTAWDKLCDENGQPSERTLRTLEAYLMTARKNGLPVQFTFFAFLPEVLGGINPYLDPQAIRRQQTLMTSVVARFHDVPFLAWDLINEPSFSQHMWTMRPNGDSIELAKWNEWLSRRYPDRAALAAAWNLPVSEIAGVVPLPKEIEFAPRGVYLGHNSLKLYDFFLFAQETFANWVQTMRGAVHDTRSQQLITVGQDEGGIEERVSPAFWTDSVDFTVNHSWWENDFLLWDSLLAKQPGKALLIQETGLQRELNPDEIARRTPESEAALLERKLAISFVQGSGAIEWLWNTNSYMTFGNETPIGAVRTDATEKPEADVLRSFAAFAHSVGEHLRSPEQPSIAIVTSQAAQFSVHADLQLEAQRTAVRALCYSNRLTAYAVAENQIAKLGSPKLVVLPSPQALTETAWRALLKYATDGGNLLVTGAVDRDEHWQPVPRAAELKLDAQTEPLTYRNATLRLDGRAIPLSFDQAKQNVLASPRFKDGASFKEISYGKGHIFWTAYPVELAEGTQATADLYAYVAGRVGISPAFELESPLPSGVLVYPVVLEDSILYVMVSENADDAKIGLRDKLTGVQLTLRLPSQHGALALIGKQQKSVVAKYGF